MANVIRVKATRLRRGDAILAVCPPQFGQRAAGASKRSRVLGRFVMRKQRGEFIAIVYRREADGVVVGHESSYSPDVVAYVLR